MTIPRIFGSFFFGFVLLSTVMVGMAAAGSDGVDYGPWACTDFYATASKYYQGISEKKLSGAIVTLNDLEDIGTAASPANQSKSRGVVDFDSILFRWGRKPQSVSPVYHVVEHNGSEFKADFKGIFGKSVKHYQAVCVTYAKGDEKAQSDSSILDSSGMFTVGAHASIDLWLMDEDGKCYVILGYAPARGFKGNMRSKVLERLGIRDAKLWE